MSKNENTQLLLSDSQLSSLETIADDAVQKATDAVGSLLGIQIETNAIHARGVEARKVADLFDDPEALTAAIYLKVDGSVPGHAAFVCPEQDALHIVDLLTGCPVGTTQFFDDFGLSALQELGNILTSSYLNALSDYTGLTFLPHPPQIAVDMCYALITAIMVGSVEAANEAITIVTEFGKELGPFQGHFVYIPDQPSLPVLLEHLQEAA